MSTALPERIRALARWAYAIAYCSAYGFLPVLIWGVSDWALSAPLILGMASVQMILFYIGARRSMQITNPSRFERLLWPIGHTCIIGGYCFIYYNIAAALNRK